jgi:cytochrome c oxidase assembly protein subunit 15
MFCKISKNYWELPALVNSKKTCPKKTWLLRLSVLGVILVFCVVMLGAWTRLRDAGLGCPDWPTCYGMLTVPTQAHDVLRAEALYPDQPVEASKAWPETIHRYFASTLGLLMVVLAAIAVTGRREPGMPVKQALFMVGLVCLQGAFGAWTVTMKLFPPVVTTHLLLGFTTFAMLTLLALRAGDFFPTSAERHIRALRPLAFAGLVILVLQIALGGWTASNYAAAVCTGLPVCQSGWTHLLNFDTAFQFFGHDAPTYQYAPHLLPDAKITIHVMHRIGAILTTLMLLSLIAALWRRATTQRYRVFAAVLLTALIAQVLLGVSNIVFQLPLAVAVAHNAVAAVLLQILVALIFSLSRERVA